jgi:predicted nucleic acid-binding Zn ribbon protein
MAMIEESLGEESPIPVGKKRCIACGEPIFKDASLCKECSSNQKKWRNELKYWAAVAGVLTLVASGAAFTGSLGFQLWQRLFGTELAVSEIDPFGKTVVWNLTGDPIYLKTISVRSSAPVTDLTWDVDKTIAARTDIPVTLMQIAGEIMHGTVGDMYGKAPGNYARLDSQTFARLKNNELIDKFVPTFLLPDGGTVTQLRRNYKEEFQTFPCDISISFMRLRGGSSSSITVPCTGTFRTR